MKEEYVMHVSDGGPVDAFCGYFDVLFKGSAENPADVEVCLNTAPDPTGAPPLSQLCPDTHSLPVSMLSDGHLEAPSC